MPNRFVDLKRFRVDGACYFVTSKTFRNFPYFREPIFCDLFVENLRLCKRLKGFELYGWFLGYDHFHLAIRPMGKFDLSKIMQCLKRHINRDINCLITHNPVGAIRESRLQANNKMFAPVLRHMEIGLIRAYTRFVLKYDHHNLFPKFQWQKSFYDHYCRNETDFRNCLEYIAQNPVKHHLPMDWPYIFTTSFANDRLFINPKFADLLDDCGLS